MTEPPFRRVAIAGVGLLGGSLGAALRRAFPGVHVRGIGRSGARLELAVARGAVDDFRLEGAGGLADRDLVVLATPIEQILARLDSLGPDLAPGAVVTDLGSTKRAICARAAAALPSSVTFVGGHPLAGKEVTGVEHSDPDLFAGAPWVLCPAEQPAEAGAAPELDRLRAVVEAVGARPIVCAPAAHDAAVGWISHLPQLLSTTLAGTLPDSGIPLDELLDLAGSGFRDMVRLAGSSFDVWRGILETNADEVDRALAAVVAQLEETRRDLRAGGLEARFDRARALYAAYRARRFASPARPADEEPPS
jgi:prephenate dehydrogenase